MTQDLIRRDLNFKPIRERTWEKRNMTAKTNQIFLQNIKIEDPLRLNEQIDKMKDFFC